MQDERGRREKMRQAKWLTALTMKILLLSLLVSTIFVGCASVVLHPISPTDIVRVKKGVYGNLTIEKDGWFLSDMYVKEVADAKVR
jgi:hypothetical protein